MTKGLNSPEPESSNSNDQELWVNNNYYKIFAESDADCDDEFECSNEESVKPSPNSGCSGQLTADHSAADVTGFGAKDQVLSLLSEYCHSKVLNLDYLLGLSNQPFTAAETYFKDHATSSSKRSINELKRPHLLSGSSPASMMLSPGSDTTTTSSTTSSIASKVILRLNSAKMIGLKDLLSTEKLNTNAIQLQLTALSQVTSSKGHHLTATDSECGGGRPKRSRREYYY